MTPKHCKFCGIILTKSKWAAGVGYDGQGHFHSQACAARFAQFAVERGIERQGIKPWRPKRRRTILPPCPECHYERMALDDGIHVRLYCEECGAQTWSVKKSTWTTPAGNEVTRYSIEMTKRIEADDQ